MALEVLAIFEVVIHARNSETVLISALSDQGSKEITIVFKWVFFRVDSHISETTCHIEPKS